MFNNQRIAWRRAFILVFSGFFLICMAPGAQAQQAVGSVAGTVKTLDGKPAEFVNVFLKGVAKGAVVNAQGHYRINNIQPGSYTLTAALAGLNTQTRAVTITAGTAQEVDFVLTENNQELQEVVISGGEANKYTKLSSEDVAKLPLKNLENPQVYSIVTAGVMKDQQNINISQAFYNVPGAVPTKDPAGGTSITLRGFTAEPAARNGVPFIGAGRSGLDLVNVDHFEVLKGPSAVLFGNTVSSYGGAVNIVTKKPFDYCKGEVNYSMGSFGLNRVSADINTPLNADKSLLLRTNAVVNREQSYLDNGHNNTVAFAPSLLYKANDRLTLSFDLELYREDLTKTPYMVFDALGVNNVSKLPLDYRTTLYNDDLNAVANTLRTYFQATYKINDHWTSQTNIAVNNERIEHSFQYYPTFLDGTHIQREIALYGPITTVNNDIQHNLRGDFTIGRVRNRLVWGVDYFHNQTAFTTSFAIVDTIDITHPFQAVTKTMADNALQTRGTTGNYPSEWNQYASYVSDLVNITDNLMVMLGGRVDRYALKGDGGYGQTSFTPKLGLIYQPVKDRISIFGNYMSGFTNNGPTVQPDGTRFTPKPEFGKQWEAGVKADVLENRLTATASYYNINIDDALRYLADGTVIQDGKQQSKGVELSLNANPAPGLNLTAGYVFNQNQYTRAATGTGKDVTGNPRNVANAWATYKFQPNTLLNGIGFGAGFNYVEKSYYDTDNTVIIPAYTLINASLFWDRARWRFGISGNNLGNKKYWAPSFTANPMPLRQLVASVTMKF